MEPIYEGDPNKKFPPATLIDNFSGAKLINHTGNGTKREKWYFEFDKYGFSVIRDYCLHDRPREYYEKDPLFEVALTVGGRYSHEYHDFDPPSGLTESQVIKLMTIVINQVKQGKFNKVPSKYNLEKLDY